MSDRHEEARIETEAAVRWCNNILHEVLNNHGGDMPQDARICLRGAVQALNDCSIELSKGGR